MLAAARSAWLCWRLFWDPRVSPFAKLVPFLAVLYAVSPVDVLSEIALPGIGVLDDAAVLALAARLFLMLVPAHVLHEHAYRIRQRIASRRNGRRKEAEPPCPPQIP